MTDSVTKFIQSELCDIYLDAGAPSDEVNGLTLEEQCRLLGGLVTPSHLSRIRNARSPISPHLASKLAAHLKNSPLEQEELRMRLLRIGRGGRPSLDEREVELPPVGHLDLVSEFFHRLSSPDAVVCVEYRDMPRADPQGRYRSYAEVAARAIASGMCFAMFQPFGRDFVNGFDAPLSVRSYLTELRNRVRAGYRAMRSMALSEIQRLGNNLDVDEKIVLYERVDAESFLCGIQLRQFYAEYRDGNALKREVWNWVSLDGDKDHFLRRDGKESAPARVIADQFFPVLRYWSEGNRHVLPNTNEKLTKDHARFARELEASSSAGRWEIFLDPLPKNP